jgi:hypothetical protein
LACLLFYSVRVLVKERGLKSTCAKRNAVAVIIIVIALAAYGSELSVATNFQRGRSGLAGLKKGKKVSSTEVYDKA